MTREEKDLLLKDLCARLPYGVKFAITNEKTDTLKSIGITEYDLIPINLFYKKPLFYLINEFGNIEYKPYLRSMSSMTEEEREEFRKVGGVMSHNIQNDTWAISAFTPEAYDWLNSHHFDYRGLIDKGLALEAPDRMYEIQD